MSLRFVPASCLQVQDKIIPFWELDFVESEDYSQGLFSYKGITVSNLTPCYWDVKDEKIVFGIIKDYYPTQKETGFKVGESVFVEIKHHVLQEDVIEKIIFEKFESQIKKAEDMEKYELNWYFTEKEQEDLKIKDIFELRLWQPYYVMKSGKVVKWEHQLYHKG